MCRNYSGIITKIPHGWSDSVDGGEMLNWTGSTSNLEVRWSVPVPENVKNLRERRKSFEFLNDLVERQLRIIMSALLRTD